MGEDPTPAGDESRTGAQQAGRLVSGQRGRFPHSVYGTGDEPDPRFTLANERTFLAWVGAGLALISAGVGLDSLASALNPGLRLAASVVLVLGGIVSAGQAWFGWMNTEKSLRHHRPLPATTFAVVLPVVLGIAAILILVGMIA